MATQPTRTYEALLSNPQHVAQAQAAKRAIEGVGGSLQIIRTLPQPGQPGMTLVVVTLPSPYLPDAFLPGLPFYVV